MVGQGCSVPRGAALVIPCNKVPVSHWGRQFQWFWWNKKLWSSKSLMLTCYHHTKPLFWLFEVSEFSSCSSRQQTPVQLFQHNGPSSWAQQKELWGDLWRIISQSPAQLKMTEANASVMDSSLTAQHRSEWLFLHRQGLSLPCLPQNFALSSPVTKLQSSHTPAMVPTWANSVFCSCPGLTKWTHLYSNCWPFSKRPHLETSPPQSNYPSSPATCPYVAALLIYMLILLSLLQRGELFVKNLTLQPEFRPSHYLPANLGRYG